MAETASTRLVAAIDIAGTSLRELHNASRSALASIRRRVTWLQLVAWSEGIEQPPDWYLRTVAPLLAPATHAWLVHGEGPRIELPDGWPEGYTTEKDGGYVAVFRPDGGQVESDTPSKRWRGLEAAREAAWVDARR